MQTGTALHAPEGYRSLIANQTYYFLQNNRSTGRALLLLFAKGKRWLAHLYILPSNEFEKCLAEGSIVQGESFGRAPFLGPVHGMDLHQIDLDRRNIEKAHTDRVQDRLLKISPLIELERQVQILSAPDPEKEINKYANQNGLNRQRTRFWFFSYLCFGRDMWTLFPHYFNCGRWERLEHEGHKKLGRKSTIQGKKSGDRMKKDDINLIISSYLKLRKQGEPLTSIYTEAMRKYFNAIVIKSESGCMQLVSSTGEALPTFHQYRYQLIKELGIDEIQKWRWGDSKHRRAKASYKGKFSSSTCNLLERTEADAYYTEKPRGMNGEPLPALAVTRIVDVTSGMRIGIGFAFKKEDGTSYDAALFCAAIPKKQFCRYLGIDIEEEEWPSIGLSPHHITDRGPGIKPEPGHKEYAGHGLVIREFTPSGQGQGKSIVESSQRRRTKLEGPHQETLSDLSIYQLAVREVRRLLLENQSSDVNSRMTPEMLGHAMLPNPIGIWNFLDQRARNDGQLMPFEDAVRRFLPHTTVTLSRDGVWLRSQCYSSETLRATKLLDRVSTIGTQKLKAYFFPVCVRHIWVAVENQLIEVDAQLNLRDDEQMLYRSYEDLLQEDECVRQSKIKLKEHALASAVKQKTQFKEQTNAEWHAGRTTRASTKRSRASHAEEKELQSILKGKELEDAA